MKSDGKVFSGDMEALVEQLLKRVEALEAEVALLKGEPLQEESASLDPIDLDFGQEDEILAVPVAQGAEVAESLSAEDEPVSASVAEEIPTEEKEETAAEEMTLEVEPDAQESSLTPSDLPEEVPSEEIPPVQETVTPSEEAASASEPEEIPMEDLPSEEDDLPFDLPEEDAPFVELNPVEEAPVLEIEEEIPVEEPMVAVPEEEGMAVENEETPSPEEEPSSEPGQPKAEESPSPDSDEIPAETSDEGELLGLFGEAIEPPAPAKRGRPRKEQKNINEAATPKESVMDALYMDSAWRKDIQGPEVRDIRSAISLNDRVLFINRLFRKDSMLYQDVIGKINGMNDLDEVVSFLGSTFPEWKMDSDDVYKFMMAVRRKIR